jgi:predicted O-methyltransferase YrrM
MRIGNANDYSYFCGGRNAAPHFRFEDIMTTLTSPPVAPLLDRLFTDAEASSAALRPFMATMSAEDRVRIMGSKTDYRDFYGVMKDAHLAVSRETGSLLYMLARSTAAKAIVEFGTSFGVSTLHLAAALRDNGGGRLISSEFEPGKVASARATIAESVLADLVEIREGDALETLARDLPETIDLVLLDGAKPLYADILDLLEPRLRPGAILVADNVDHCPDYLERVGTIATGYMSMPFNDEVELSIRLR